MEKKLRARTNVSQYNNLIVPIKSILFKDKVYEVVTIDKGYCVKAEDDFLFKIRDSHIKSYFYSQKEEAELFRSVKIDSILNK